MACIYFCNNRECGNLKFSQRPFCQACECQMVEAPECECGAPIHDRFNRQLRPANRLCMGCGKLLTDEFMRKRWLLKLRDVMGVARKQFP